MLTGGQVTAGTASTSLSVVPPGPCSVTIVNSGTATAYLGFGTAATASGIPLPSGAVFPFFGYQGSQGSRISVVTAAGSASVGWLLSTPSGGTGL
jgi:hypothetical protein